MKRSASPALADGAAKKARPNDTDPPAISSDSGGGDPALRAGEPARGAAATPDAEQRLLACGPAAQAMPQTPQVAATEASTLHVLVAEDDELSRKLIARILEKEGCSVRLTTNGREALAALQASAFDVAFLDVNLPELDGLQVVQEERKQLGAREGLARAACLFVAVSAHRGKDMQNVARESGFDGYLEKPLQRKELLMWLRRARPRAGAGSAFPDPSVREEAPRA